MNPTGSSKLETFLQKMNMSIESDLQRYYFKDYIGEIWIHQVGLSKGNRVGLSKGHNIILN